MDFQEQVVLITGGSKGIGKAMASAFAQKGALVIINYGHDEGAARKAEGEIRQAGGKVQTRQADITRSEEVNSMVKEILDRFHRLHGLGNKAGGIRAGHRLLMSEKDWEEGMG